MLSEIIRTQIEQATVTLTKKGGQGVLIKGNLILTSAHCIDFSVEGGMVLGDYFIEDLLTSRGELKCCPVALEPMTDIAALGALDGQENALDAELFERFCEQTSPVSLFTEDLSTGSPIAVYVLTHHKTWIKGTATPMQARAKALFVEWPEQIEGGTSGGPIITESGQLVGVVSNASITAGPCSGLVYRSNLCLPVWIIQMIANSTSD
jgi:hypothetical protein